MTLPATEAQRFNNADFLISCLTIRYVGSIWGCCIFLTPTTQSDIIGPLAEEYLGIINLNWGECHE